MNDSPQPGPGALRLFVAITLPAAVVASVSKAQDRLRRALPGENLRWTRAEQFHLTLKFLGDVLSDRVPALQGAVSEAARHFSPLALTARGVGCFPDLRRPRVVWIGVADETGELMRLQREIETACAPFASAGLEGRFSGHVTLARVRAVTPLERVALERFTAEFTQTSFGAWTAAQIELIQSRLSPAGAKYCALGSAPLLG